MNRKVVFLFNLLQDVNILRPLVRLAASNSENDIILCISEKFIQRDNALVWSKELGELAGMYSTLSFKYSNAYEVVKLLSEQKGIIFAGSESNLPAHDMTRDVFRAVGNDFIKVSLQHGYECIGFLQSKQHDLAHGTNVTFSADIVCGWFDEDRLYSMVDSQKRKLLTTGPTALLDLDLDLSHETLNYGLICENLHSVRMSISGDKKQNFIDDFNKFSLHLSELGRQVGLRPHPGGQFVIKNKIPLPKNAVLENKPIYKVDLSGYKYGVSAPSSIIIDMVLAQIPVAVWCDKDKGIDIGNYKGLHVVSDVADLIAFDKDAIKNPSKYLDAQNVFLKRIGLQCSSDIALSKFRKLIEFSPKKNSQGVKKANSPRIMFVANGPIPTLQLSFLKPLEGVKSKGDIELETLYESDLPKDLGVSDMIQFSWIESKFEEFAPTHIVFCRYSGPMSRNMLTWAKSRNIPTIYHIDDDLLNIPANIGQGKFKHHNSDNRIATVRYLLDNVNLVYASTKNLAERLKHLTIKTKIYTGVIYCPGEIINTAKRKPVQTIGYMASADHSHNLEMILDAVCSILDKYRDVQFELFGSIPVPERLMPYNSQVTVVPPVSNYSEFLEKFAAREWDVGLCPLTPINFNLMKANTKWVEYTASGIAVVASKGTAYDYAIGDDCGVLADTCDEWTDALDKLISDENFTFEVKSRAQDKLVREFSQERLIEQINEVLKIAANTCDI